MTAVLRQLSAYDNVLLALQADQGEPTGGISPEERRVTGELLAPIKSEGALVIVEHDLDFIRDICDVLTVLDQGRVLDTGTVDETFPFSDLSDAKLRPEVVLGDGGKDDFILCQVTSTPYADPRALELNQAAFTRGSLQRTSYARPGKLFTAHRSLIRGRAGIREHLALCELVGRVVGILQHDLPS
jgi:mRNA interferase MazF